MAFFICFGGTKARQIMNVDEWRSLIQIHSLVIRHLFFFFATIIITIHSSSSIPMTFMIYDLTLMFMMIIKITGGK